ncbi:MAG: SDR family oxidoreductase [Planctomycetota bacterium]
MARIVVVGASGMIGSAIEAAARLAGHEVVSTALTTAYPGMVAYDLAGSRVVREVFESAKADWVFYPAGITNPDTCEDDLSLGNRVNVESPRLAAECAFACGAKWFCAFSGESVFDGKNGPYSEEDLPNPISVFGRTKMEMENVLLATKKPILVVRTTWILGAEAQRKNFVYQLRQAALEARTISFPSDQQTSLTYSVDLGSAAIELAAMGRTGILHVAGPDLHSRAEIAGMVCETFGLPASTARAVPTEVLRPKARRPLNAGLKIDKALGILKTTRLRPARDALRALREVMEREEAGE